MSIPKSDPLPSPSFLGRRDDYEWAAGLSPEPELFERYSAAHDHVLLNNTFSGCGNIKKKDLAPPRLNASILEYLL